MEEQNIEQEQNVGQEQNAEQEQKQNTEQVTDQSQDVEDEQKDAADVVDDEFVKAKLSELMGDASDELLIKEFTEQLDKIGITDRRMAERALEYVCSARRDRVISDCAETMRHFGATEDNITPEYTKAMDEARTAITAIDAKVPGIKQLFYEAGIQSNLKVVLMLQKILPFVGEEPGGMNSGAGVGATGEVKGYAETIFGGYPSEAEQR